MTDFSHLHALEERAVRIRERMFSVENNSKQWKAQATQLFQTEKEIADERTFLGLEDMDADKLYAGLLDDHESEVVLSQVKVALTESVKLQTHYAGLLNAYDGGGRVEFSSADAWIKRLKELGKI